MNNTKKKNNSSTFRSAVEYQSNEKDIIANKSDKGRALKDPHDRQTQPAASEVLVKAGRSDIAGN